MLSGCQGGVNIDDVIACVRMPSDEIVVIDGFNLPLPSLYASVWDWVRSGCICGDCECAAIEGFRTLRMDLESK